MKWYLCFVVAMLFAALISLTAHGAGCDQEGRAGMSHENKGVDEAVEHQHEMKPETSGDGEAAKYQEKLYSCPMPSDNFFSRTPGDCPKCGMKLVEVGAEKQKELYTCPMPEENYFSREPGACPKCGMDLVPNK